MQSGAQASVFYQTNRTDGRTNDGDTALPLSLFGVCAPSCARHKPINKVTAPVKPNQTSGDAGIQIR
jgi:hypothetical protein